MIEEVCANIVPEPLTRVVPHEWVVMRRGYVLSCAGGALSLALFVPGVFADHHDVAVTTNDFALVANRLDAGVDLHCVSPSSLASYPEFRAVPSVRLLVAVNDAAS